MTRSKEIDREHRTGRRTIRSRIGAFLGHWLAAFMVFVLACLLRVIININDRFNHGDRVVSNAIVLAVTLGTVGLIWRAERVGRALDRKEIFYRHVSVTILGSGAVILSFVIWGFTMTRTLLAVLALMAGAISWNLHLTNALRADPREKGQDDGGWPEIFGLPNTRVSNVQRSEHAVTATLSHGPGDTAKGAQAALDKIEAAANAVSGRSRIVKRANAGSSEITLVLSDPFKQWMELPGLSHPGGSFADPIRTSYYDTGVWEWYWFAHGTTASGEPRSAHSRLRMGMTRSGKTGEAKNEVAEVASRRDVVLLYADLTKGLQGTGPLMEFLTCFADTAIKVNLLFQALVALVRYRTDVMGAAGFIDWTPEVYEKLGFAAVYFFMDEADEFITRDDFVWLCTKGLSVGIFLSVTVPRADHKSMPTTARYSFGAAKCFGVGDAYSAAFALSDATREAGADPQSIGITIQGVHWHDGAPGIAPQMYPVPLRSGRSTHDQLADWVRAARATFTPAIFTNEEITVLNENGAYDATQPDKARSNGHATPAAPIGMTSIEVTPAMTQAGTAYDSDDPKPVNVEAMPSAQAGDAEDYSKIDPRKPVRCDPADTDEFPDDKPRPASHEQMVDEFKRVLVEMVDEGATEVRNLHLRERSQVWSESTVSRLLTSAAAGNVVMPPGITLERFEGQPGRYRIILERALSSQ